MFDARDSFFYHIYPLGLCGAPADNDRTSVPNNRLNQLDDWAPHMQALGVNALYLGPVFESERHGYDTIDYYHVDRRLGDHAALAHLVRTMHQHGIRVILDTVFNHVGRDFWAFRDLRERGQDSPYRDWFTNVHFDQRSPYGDPFSYEGWHGHFNLVKLNLQHPDVRNHLFEAVAMWVHEFGIDGLRLDAADVMDLGFLRDLATYSRRLKADFWLIGEIIHGDYRTWANPEMLDSVTNYEAYKGLWSSLNDANYFEIAYALNRQFGPDGIYRTLPLYNFADNHDVNRVASTLHNPAHLYPLHLLLFTMPGVPSIYYGSEWGISGAKRGGDDSPMRPCLNLAMLQSDAPHPALVQAISHLAQLRASSTALRHGDYQQLHVAMQQLAFLRSSAEQQIVVALNASDQPATIDIPFAGSGQLVDLLNPGYAVAINNGRAQIEAIPSCWGRIMEWRR